MCQIWETAPRITYARDPLIPETAGNFQDTDETVKHVRNYSIWRSRNNAKRAAYCK